MRPGRAGSAMLETMSDTIERENDTSDLVDEIRTWLEENWDPDLTVAEWWERLGLAGWAAPTLPTNAYGRGLSRERRRARAERDRRVRRARRARRARPAARRARRSRRTAPTSRSSAYVRDIVTGQQAWCQLFSEPGAGSDLAGLQAKAMLDGDEWIVNGQKVWTSGGHIADLGMLIARTDPDVPKHQGITYFAIDMHQPGVDVRPLREMTGRALFNEVFLTDARVPADAIIGGLNNGWAVANTTLAHERAGLGAGGGSAAASAAIPGTVGGHLEQRAGDFVRGPGAPAAGRWRRRSATRSKMMISLAKGDGMVDDADDPPGPHAAPHPQRDRPDEQPAGEGGQGQGRGDRRHGQHRQAVDERHRAPAARPRPAHRRPAGHAARLRLGEPQGARRGHRATRSSASSPRWRCSRRPRRSTAAPTRSSATSSASGCSACPRSRTRTRSSPSPSSPRTPELDARHHVSSQRLSMP